MNKKVIAILIVLVIIVAGFFIVQNKGDKSLATVKEKGKFVVGLDDNFPPMGFRDEGGNIVGFDIDLAKELAERMGVQVEFKPVEWDGVLFSLKNGTIDVIWNALTITEERAEQIAFSKPYLDNRQIIVVQEDSTINNKDDLVGKIIGIQLGSSSENALNNEQEVVNKLEEIRRFSNNTEALMDLQTGRIHAVVVDEILGRYYISKKPDVYRVLEDDFGHELYGVGIRQEDIKFKEEIDVILDEMKEDGTAAEISNKWFGEDILKK